VGRASQPAQKTVHSRAGSLPPNEHPPLGAAPDSNPIPHRRSADLFPHGVIAPPQVALIAVERVSPRLTRSRFRLRIPPFVRGKTARFSATPCFGPQHDDGRQPTTSYWIAWTRIATVRGVGKAALGGGVGGTNQAARASALYIETSTRPRTSFFATGALPPLRCTTLEAELVD